MSKSFKNVPDEIAEEISKKVHESFAAVYRAIGHVGALEPEDFYPTFADEKNKRLAEKHRKKGGMANVIASQRIAVTIETSSVSLCPTFEIAEKRVKNLYWFSSEAKKNHPGIAVAVGATNEARGVSVQDNPSHISYYLYDYEENNPCVDFQVLEEYVK